jgi:hypothetical protein
VIAPHDELERPTVDDLGEVIGDATAALGSRREHVRRRGLAELRAEIDVTRVMDFDSSTEETLDEPIVT